MVKPHGRLVLVGSKYLTVCPPPAYRPDSLSGPLRALMCQGCLILRGASHLDAFSGYPLRTWLPSAYPWQDNWYTRGSSAPVLSY